MKKKCPLCKQTKEATDFYRSRAAKDGCSSYCKACMKEKATERYQKDPERVRAEARRWARSNPGSVMASAYAWKKRNPDKVKAAAKKYYEKKKAEKQAYKEALYQARLKMKEEIMERKRKERLGDI